MQTSDPIHHATGFKLLGRPHQSVALGVCLKMGQAKIWRFVIMFCIFDGVVAYIPEQQTVWILNLNEFNMGFHHMVVSINGGSPKSSHVLGFSLVNQPFWVPPCMEPPHMLRESHCTAAGASRCSPLRRRSWNGGFHSPSPNSWLVYFMENRIKMDDLEFGGYPYFRKPPYVGNCLAM